MKKAIIVIFTFFLVTNCESSGSCTESAIIFNNKTNLTITLTSINGIRTLKPGDKYTIKVYTPQEISYYAIAGNRRWENSYSLGECDLKSVDLEI